MKLLGGKKVFTLCCVYTIRINFYDARSTKDTLKMRGRGGRIRVYGRTIIICIPTLKEFFQTINLIINFDFFFLVPLALI